MPEFTFIHTADLHLGAPFRGLDAAVSERFSGNILSEAPFAALERLEALCLAENAAFLVVAGDMYDSGDGVLRARFALRDMFARLGNAGIRVFLAHGNHDPLDAAGNTNPVPWPPNVTVFGETPGVFCVMRDDAPLALVYGISHTEPREKNNLALRLASHEPSGPDTLSAPLPESLPPGLPRIAVLHCAVGGAGDGHAPYAPCVLGDLTGAAFAYWALGHVHQPKILADAPMVAYAGSMQGMHINETGPHGCFTVRVDGNGCCASLVPLAPVRWEKTTIACDSEERVLETLDDIVDTVLDRLDAIASEKSETAPAPDAVFCRVTLTGHTHLDRELRKPGALATLVERLRGETAAQDGAFRTAQGGRTRVWLKDVVLQTSPAVDFTELAKRNDLMGEAVRIADAACADAVHRRDLLGAALTDLYANRRVKKAVAHPDEEELRHLTASARSLLCSLLEED